MRYGLLIALILGLASSTHAATKYNFIVMMADDLGAAELACYGNAQHKTPNLDRLAEQGVRFETAYSTPICTSTRVMLMTGQYGFRTGYYNFFERTWSPLPSSPEHDIGSKVTFADLLKPAGYATALAGKWQLTGEGENLVRDTGFDEYRIWAYKHNLPPGVEHTGAWQNEGRQVTARYFHPSIVQNGKYMPTKATDYGPDLFADFVIDVARRHRDQPFFIYYPMALTHEPWDPTPHDPKGGLKANVEYMDHVVGRVVKAIDDMGLRERTVIIFTGDNGTGKNGKGTVTEKGARVPFIASCPGTIQQGLVSRELVSLTDVLPTLLELGGAKMPKDHVIDGVSLVPTLRTGGSGGSGSAEHRPWLFSYLGDGRMLRDKRWLLEGDGRFYDCGDSRDGTNYKDVTNSSDPQVIAARKRFETILKDLPGPEGHPGLKQPGADGDKKSKKKNKQAA